MTCLTDTLYSKDIQNVISLHALLWVHYSIPTRGALLDLLWLSLQISSCIWYCLPDAYNRPVAANHEAFYEE